MPTLTEAPITELTAADRAQIIQLFSEAEAAWNAADGPRYGAAFTPDADFVNVYGMHDRGAQQIGNSHTWLLNNVFAGSRNQYTVTSIAPLAPDLALVHLKAHLHVPAGPLAGDRFALPSAVVTRTGSQWQIRAFHNTLIESPPLN